LFLPFPNLLETGTFWWARNLVIRVRFFVTKRLFGASQGVQDEGTRNRALFEIIKITLPQLLFSIIVALLLKWLDTYLSTMIPDSKWPMPTDGDYATLLATIAGIGGVFIGLYYAGVTAVGSSIYAKVPNNIRDLLARDQVGNVYMRYLAFLTFLSLVLISFKVFGMPKIRVAIVVLTLMSGIGIVAVIKLGQRAFYLFDPTALSDSIFRELQRLVKRASVGGFGWDDTAFQDHANRVARSTIATLRTLGDISVSDTNLSGRPFVELCKQLLRFLMFYEKAKAKIPSASRWYTQRLIHRDWYYTDDSRVSMAHQTGTTLTPDSVPDLNWVEYRLVPIITQCLLTNLKNGQYDIVFELLGYYDAYIKGVSEHSGADRALSLVEDLIDKILPTIAIPAERQVLETEVLEAIGLVDLVTTLPITCILSFIKTQITDRQSISSRLHGMNWRRKNSLYTARFKTHLLPQLEWLQPRLEFERFVQGSWKSPLWYQADILRIEEAKNYAKDTAVVFERAPKLYARWADTFITNKHPWLAAAVIGREWEYCHKVEANLKTLEDGWKDLMAERKLNGLDWPALDRKSWEQAVRELGQNIQGRMAAVSALLSFSKRPEHFPDYAGQFVHATGESILGAFIEGDSERVKTLYSSYFLGCLNKFNELRPTSATADDKTIRKMRVAGASLLDLVCLSGYAKLFADLHSKDEIWTTVTSTWDKYLSSVTPSPVPMFAALLGLTEGYWGIPHRGFLRSQWSINVNRKLSEVPRKDVVIGGGFISVESIAIHPSPLVRMFAREHFGGLYDGEEIFASFYLKKRPEGVSLSWGQKTTNLEKSIERQERNAEPS
jgi:hypothetical protein